MKKWTSFVGTFILSYLFWILFLIQDFNILKFNHCLLSNGKKETALLVYKEGNGIAERVQTTMETPKQVCEVSHRAQVPSLPRTLLP